MKDKEQERIKKYGCDGRCYTSYYMCPRVEICPETRIREFVSTIVAMLILLFIPIAVIIAAILMIVRCL